MKSVTLYPPARSVLDIDLMEADPTIREVRDEYAAALRGDLRERPNLSEFDAEIAEAIHRSALLKNKEPFDERAFARKMREHGKRARQPRVTDRAGDLWRALAQDEILQGFWPSIDPRGGTRGRHPGIFAKAFLFSAAMIRHSPHFNAVHDLLFSDARLRAAFRTIEESAARHRGYAPKPLEPRTYEQTLRQMHAVAERIPVAACIESNIRMVKEIHRLLGVETVYLGTDGTATPAHVPQVAAGGSRPEREKALRDKARNASFRMLKSPNGSVRAWRGYYTVALVDLATGLPLVWEIRSAELDEAKSLKHLLHTLYLYWPDISVAAITADGAWDEKWAMEWCLVNYGIHLVAPRRVDHGDVRFELNETDYPLIGRYYGDGRVECRKHGKTLVRDGYEGYPRDGLPPGSPAPRRRFRLRYSCPASPSCGRLSLPMEEHWTALAYYPHTLSAGNSVLHAERLALQAQRNTCESLFSALKVGSKLALSGAGRTRTAKEATVFALLSLALMDRSARMLADLRIQRDLFPDALPPSLQV